MSEELKPCPFCGGAAYSVSRGPGRPFVRCERCGAIVSEHSQKAAANLWNSRAIDTRAEISHLTKEVERLTAERDSFRAAFKLGDLLLRQRAEAAETRVKALEGALDEAIAEWTGCLGFVTDAMGECNMGEDKEALARVRSVRALTRGE